jgi:demethylmenaquinone methyltransferase/2-methoxy-6-polyprenyl-1,4-benzoquinol methylase
MFQEIAPRYDAANDLISFGTHRLWRKQLSREARADTPHSALDICTGTGDVVFELAKSVPSLTTIVGVDFVQEMIDIASKKLAKQSPAPQLDRIRFMQGNGIRLPFPDESFDLVTISFGIRNIPDPVTCLLESARVLKKGGALLVLEFGQPKQRAFRTVYDIYSRNILPTIGGLVTGYKEAYEYLPETASRFPCGEHFCQLLSAAGFKETSSRPLTFGVVYLYKGYVG